MNNRDWAVRAMKGLTGWRPQDEEIARLELLFIEHELQARTVERREPKPPRFFHPVLHQDKGRV